jgi:hypothetical protein
MPHGWPARLIEKSRRPPEVGPRFVELEQPPLVRGEAEEVVLLLDPLRLDIVQRAFAVDEVVLGLELLAADAVEARVDVLVDVAVVVDPLQERADEDLVVLVARPDEVVGLGIQPRRERTPRLGDLVDVILCSEALRLSDPPDFGRVLVDAGEKERLVAALAVVSREDVRRDRRVRMPYVGPVVHVVDRCRHVEPHRRP